MQEISLRKPVLKNGIAESIEIEAKRIAFEYPAFGQVRASDELKKIGVFISPAWIRCVWLRNGIETFAIRLKLLEKRAAEDGLLLTEAQVAALERSKDEKQAIGEIETAHQGYLGAQDTYCVVTIKGLGRIYQQTYIDAYTRVAQAKLYDRKNTLVAADMLNDRVFSHV